MAMVYNVLWYSSRLIEIVDSYLGNLDLYRPCSDSKHKVRVAPDVLYTYNITANPCRHCFLNSLNCPETLLSPRIPKVGHFFEKD